MLAIKLVHYPLTHDMDGLGQNVRFTHFIDGPTNTDLIVIDGEMESVLAFLNGFGVTYVLLICLFPSVVFGKSQKKKFLCLSFHGAGKQN